MVGGEAHPCARLGPRAQGAPWRERSSDDGGFFHHRDQSHELHGLQPRPRDRPVPGCAGLHPAEPLCRAIPKFIEQVVGVEGADIEVAYLQAPGHRLELIEYRGPADRGRVESRPCDAGFAHIAFDVDDIHAAIAAARAAGSAPLGAPIAVNAGTQQGRPRGLHARRGRHHGRVHPEAEGVVFYETARNDRGQPHDPFKSCAVPRPIGWIATVDSRFEMPVPGLRSHHKTLHRSAGGPTRGSDAARASAFGVR